MRTISSVSSSRIAVGAVAALGAPLLPMWTRFYHAPGRGGGSSGGSGFERRRREELDRLFSSRSTHDQRRRRVALMEADARVDAPAVPANAVDPTTAPTVASLLDLDGPAAATTTALTAAYDSAVAAAGSDPRESLLVDDDFAYLPAVARAVAVPGSQIVPPGLRRYRVDIQYKGEHFFGWDRAALLRARDHERNANSSSSGSANPSSSTSGARSARDAIEEALKAALDVGKVEVVPSCILETGVHARRLVCHVDVPAALEMQPRTVLQRAHLWLQQAQDPLAILSFRPAPPDFHALHSCRRRVFVCRMLNRVAPPLFDLGSQWHLDRPLDVDRMNEACELLRGRRDFTAFADPRTHAALRRSGDGGVRSVERLQVVRQDDEVLLWCAGRSFLRGQLRCMAGVLRMVGQGLWDEAALEHFVSGGFATRDLGAPRGRLQPPLAPSHSIALWASEYDTDTPEVVQPVQSGPLEM